MVCTVGDAGIDWARVQELRSEIGPDCFDEIVTMFLQETDEVICRMRRQPGGRSLDSDLHFLKGSALNLGFADLAQACLNGQRSLSSDASADTVIQSVIDVYHASRAAFLNGLQASASQPSPASGALSGTQCGSDQEL